MNTVLLHTALRKRQRELQREKTHQTVTSNFLQNNYKTCLCWHTPSISRYIPRDDALLTSSSANTILLLRDDIGFLELKKLLMNSLFFYPREPRKTFFSKRKLLLCAFFVILEDQKGLGKQKHANYDFECRTFPFLLNTNEGKIHALQIKSGAFSGN